MKIHKELEEAPYVVVSDSICNLYIIPSKLLIVFDKLDRQIQDLQNTEHAGPLEEIWNELFMEHGVDLDG